MQKPYTEHMFKNFPQSERAYIALKEYYRQKINDAINEYGVTQLADSINCNRDLIYKTLKRGSFAPMRKLAKKIENIK